MHPRRAVKQKDPALPASVLDYICYRHTRSSLQEIRLWMGDNRFLEFLATFAGSYLILPTSKDINELYYDYMAAQTVQKIKDARKKGDLMLWNQLEGQLLKIAKRTKRKYRNAYTQGVKVLKLLEKTQRWIHGMEVWQKKYLRQEDDKYEAQG